MSRKQKLKNAVILGVMLSSITAGSVWAADPIYVDKDHQNPELGSYKGDVVIENNSEVNNGFISGLGAQGWIA